MPNGLVRFARPETSPPVGPTVVPVCRSNAAKRPQKTARPHPLKGLLLGGALWAPDGGLVWDVLLMVLALAAILALAYFASRALSVRMRTLTKTPHMRILDRLVLSRDKYVLILQIGERILCVGVAQNNISLLTEMESQEFYRTGKQQAFWQTDREGADVQSAAGRPSAFSGFTARFWSCFVSYFTGRPPRLFDGEKTGSPLESRSAEDAVPPAREKSRSTDPEPGHSVPSEPESASGPTPASTLPEKPSPRPADCADAAEPPADAAEPPADAAEPFADAKAPVSSPVPQSSPAPRPEPVNKPEPQSAGKHPSVPLPKADPGLIPEVEQEPPLSALFVSMPELPDTASAEALLSRYQKPVPLPPAPDLPPEPKWEPVRKPPSRLRQLKAQPMFREESGGADFGELLRRELDREKPTAKGEGDGMDVLLSKLGHLKDRYEKKLESER